MEDAFVSLARTGKIETADLVDFALRQLFRLAAQAAVANVAGGGGGGLLGGIVGNLFSLFTGPAPGSTASILHDGGIAGRDGRARAVDPRLFAAAPRLHTGGLLPGEVPAILEEDERVLTLAQQQSTAETIKGLAALAANPRGASPAGGAAPVINVNVIGAPAQPRVGQPRQNGDGTFDLDIVFDQIEERLAGNLARGRGLAPAVAGRFNLRGAL
ncbi:MAG: hypothetical protein IBX58_03125 [Roseovarius sp.]|nr:hypothetical protein [Roseovarius sp.]